jgi:hypothetical protein
MTRAIFGGAGEAHSTSGWLRVAKKLWPGKMKSWRIFTGRAWHFAVALKTEFNQPDNARRVRLRRAETISLFRRTRFH